MQNVYKLPKSERRQEENKRVLYNLQEICEKKEWKNIAVLSSTKFKKDNVVKILKETAKKIGMEGYTFHEIPPLSVRADAVKKIQKYDAVLLAEKYNYTKYSEFEETLRLLKECQVNVLGVVMF